MTCDERRDLIPFYVLGTLDSAEHEALRRHLDTGCPTCRLALAAEESVGAILALSLEPVSPPARVRERLMKRIAQEAERPMAGPLNLSGAIQNGGNRLTYWIGSFAAGAAAALGAVLVLEKSPIRSHSSGIIERRLAQLEGQIVEMQTTRTRTEQNILLPRSAAVQFVSLEATKDAVGAKADLYWDRERGVWYLHTNGLKPPGAGRAYELWFIAGDKKTRAGMFDVTPSGEGSLIVAIPPDLGLITLAAVTDEPVGGSEQPTGKIRLAGAVTR